MKLFTIIFGILLSFSHSWAADLVDICNRDKIGDLIASALGAASCKVVDQKKMMALTELDLSRQDLKDADLITGAFLGLDSLKKLKLRGNSIKTLPAGVFKGLKNIEELDLGSNRFKKIPANALLGLTSLKKLSFFINLGLEEIQSKGFVDLKSLKELNLRNCIIKTIAPDAFEGLDSLVILNLSANKIESLNGDTFLPVELLTKLTLGSNRLPKVPTLALSNLVNLEYLDLSENLIPELQPNDFGVLDTLKRMDLKGIGLKEIPKTLSPASSH